MRRPVAAVEAHRSRPPEAWPIRLPSRKGGQEAGGAQSLIGYPSREVFAGSHRGESEAGPIAASLLSSFGNGVAEALVFANRFSRVGTHERIRKRVDGLQHQLQLVFAVVARFIFAAAMTGDRILGGLWQYREMLKQNRN